VPSSYSVVHGAAAAADLNPAVSGRWSRTPPDQQTGVTTQPFGEQPTGSRNYSPSGHMAILVTARTPGCARNRRRKQRRRASLLIACTPTRHIHYEGRDCEIHIESAGSQLGQHRTESARCGLMGTFSRLTTPPMTSPVDGRTYISSRDSARRLSLHESAPHGAASATEPGRADRRLTAHLAMAITSIRAAHSASRAGEVRSCLCG